jgi:MinD-like ATPase involved in chromosome partitioning or flagellar assembly
MAKVIAIASQKGGVGYVKQVVMQSYPQKTVSIQE